MEMASEFRYDVQRLRAIAVIAVVLYHSGEILPAGFIGVDMFFVISGFVVMRSALPRIHNGNFSAWQFIGRRVRRLLPALTFMLVVVVLLSTWLSTVASRVQTVRTGLFASLISSNLFLFVFRPDGYFEVSEKSNALLHTWSLSLEEQFYLAFAVTLMIVLRYGARHKQLFLLQLIFSVLCIMSFLLCVVVTHRGVDLSDSWLRTVLRTDRLDQKFSFYLPITRAWEFLVGALIAVSRLRVKSARQVRDLRGIAWLLIAVSATTLKPDSFPGFSSTLPVLGTAILILFGDSVSQSSESRLNVVLEWIGDRSYGWYLWHWPMIQFVSPFESSRLALLTVAIATVIIAHLSFICLEQPLRSLDGRRPRLQTVTIAAICVVLPALSTLATVDVEPSLAAHVDEKRNCDYQLGFGKHELDGECTFRVENSKGRIALVGDSMAGMLSEGFIDAAKALGFDATIFTRGATPFLYLDVKSQDGSSEPQRAVVEYLIANDFELVVMSQANWYRLSQTDEDPDWVDYAEPIVDELLAADIDLVLVGESPAVNSDPRNCSPLQIRLGRCDADISRSRESLEAQRRGIEDELELVELRPEVVFFDDLPHLCPKNECPLRRDGNWWWRDGIHISVVASRALAGPLIDVMNKALS